MRYGTLVSEKFPTHPDAQQPENRKALKAIRKNFIAALDQLEVLRPRINGRYEAWQKALDRRREANVALEDEKPLARRSRMELASSDPAVAGNTTTLAADENSELAVRLAHNEIRRRDAARKATRQAGVSEEEEQERRTAGLWDDWEAALDKKNKPQTQDDDEMRRNMEASRRQIDVQQHRVPDGERRRLIKPPPRPSRPEHVNGHSEYRYPSISKSQPLRYTEDGSTDSRPRSKSPNGHYLPPKPPKERFEDPRPAPDPMAPLPPARPSKTMPSPDPQPIKPPPTFTFRPAAYLENGSPLRTVFLPPTLRTSFLSHAAPNTRKNLETCGMLCGTLISNALFISRVVIPEQESTSDTCETVNESALFDYCASEDLMVLGWIHTHPSQTCFMSSRDLHTHCGYQVMMPESIAIVCAPSKDPS